MRGDFDASPRAFPEWRWVEIPKATQERRVSAGRIAVRTVLFPAARTEQTARLCHVTLCILRSATSLSECSVRIGVEEMHEP